MLASSRSVTIGTSLFLFAAGAILEFAVTKHIEGVDIHAVGVILMVVGGVSLALGLLLLSGPGHDQRRRPRHRCDRPRRH